MIGAARAGAEATESSYAGHDRPERHAGEEEGGPGPSATQARKQASKQESKVSTQRRRERRDHREARIFGASRSLTSRQRDAPKNLLCDPCALCASVLKPCFLAGLLATQARPDPVRMRPTAWRPHATPRPSPIRLFSDVAIGPPAIAHGNFPGLSPPPLRRLRFR